MNYEFAIRMSHERSGVSRVAELCQHAARAPAGPAHDAAFSLLAHELLAYPSEALLRQDLLRLAERDKPAAQFGLRSCRQVFARQTFGAKQSLLLCALPVAARSRLDRKMHWADLQARLEGWVQEHLQEPVAESKTVVSEAPWDEVAMRSRAGRSLQTLSNALLYKTRIDAPTLQPPHDDWVAGLWPVAFRVSVAYADALETDIFRPGPMSASQASLKHRLEELADAQGLDFRCLGLATMANAPSMARLLALRLRVAELPLPVSLRWEGFRLLVRGAQQDVEVDMGGFEEETDQDVRAALARALGK